MPSEVKLKKPTVTRDTPEWVKNSQKVGTFCEELFISYLERLGMRLTAVCRSDDSSKGYDILAIPPTDTNPLFYEVKKLSDKKSIYLSSNELRVGNAKQDKYRLAIINKLAGETYECFIIDNPVKFFGLEGMLKSIYDNRGFFIEATTIRVKVDTQKLHKHCAKYVIIKIEED